MPVDPVKIFECYDNPIMKFHDNFKLKCQDNFKLKCDDSFHDKFERYRFFVLPVNRPFQQSTGIVKDAPPPNTVARLIIHADPGDVVWLTATVGWLATGSDVGSPDIVFAIRRDDPVTGKIIASIIEDVEFNLDSSSVTSFSGVDTNFDEAREYQYFLTAENIDIDSGAEIIGPVTFNATEIDICKCRRF